MTTAALLLAAGAGSRFTGDCPKLLSLLRGRPLLSWALEAAVESGLAGPFVVVGDADLAEAAGPTAVMVANPQWRDGLATSLQAGIAAAKAVGHDAVVVALGDQPYITPEAWRAVAAAIQTPIAIATYELAVPGKARGAGVPTGDAMSACAESRQYGHPVRLAKEVWERLPRTGEDGGRLLMRERPEVVTEVPCTGSPEDIDTVEDLSRFNSPTHFA